MSDASMSSHTEPDAWGVVNVDTDRVCHVYTVPQRAEAEAWSNQHFDVVPLYRRAAIEQSAQKDG